MSGRARLQPRADPRYDCPVKYRELRERLNALPDDQLDFTVTAYMRTPDGELMFPIVKKKSIKKEKIKNREKKNNQK